MSTTKKPPVKMAVVSIDHSCYLLPADKASKVLDLMQDAVRVHREYSSGLSITYLINGEPEAELYMVKATQLRKPEGDSRQRGGPFLLEG